jgi:myo-inositol 2-dehydrogenase/D-chiro-inositol 1-dehydrogenase
MDDFGIGIIGAGYMARTFAECLARYTRGGRLRAVAGGTRAPATAAEFGVPAHDSVQALIEDPGVDAVIVTSPHADHHDRSSRPPRLANTCSWKSRWKSRWLDVTT